MVIILVLDFPMLMNCKSILPVTRARIAVSDRGTSPRGTTRVGATRARAGGGRAARAPAYGDKQAS